MRALLVDDEAMAVEHSIAQRCLRMVAKARDRKMERTHSVWTGWFQFSDKTDFNWVLKCMQCDAAIRCSGSRFGVIQTWSTSLSWSWCKISHSCNTSWLIYFLNNQSNESIFIPIECLSDLVCLFPFFILWNHSQRFSLSLFRSAT